MKTNLFLLVLLLSNTLIYSQNIVAQYKFNGNANDNIGSSDGVIHNAVLTEDRFGNANSAYHFNGTNSYIEISNYVPFNFGLNDFSVAFWMKTTSTERETMFQKGSEYSEQAPQYWVRANDDYNNATLLFLTGNADPPSPYAATDTVVVNDGQWHHVIIQRSEKFLQLYFDCKLVATNYDVYRDVSDDIGVIIGAQNPHPGSSVISNYFDGSLDDFNIYDDDLSYVQIMDICADTVSNISEINSELNSINVYPNPSSKTLNIDGKYSFVEIYNSLGQKIFYSEYVKTINVESFEEGIYFVKIFNNEGIVFTKKIIFN